MPKSNNDAKALEIGQSLAAEALEAARRRNRERRHLIAEGDSWFNIPCHADLIDELDDRTDNDGRFFDVGNVAAHGDTLKAIAESQAQANRFAIKLQSMTDNRRPSAILLSAGGNDIASRRTLQRLIKKEGGRPGLNDGNVDALMDDLRNSFLKLVFRINGITLELLDERLPILIHGYCAGVPDGRPFRTICGDFGPWLQPAFEKSGHINIKQNAGVVEELLKRFNDMLANLNDADGAGNVHHVDLQGVLANDPNSNQYLDHWNDEMHPTPDGFKMLADRMAGELNDLFRQQSASKEA